MTTQLIIRIDETLKDRVARLARNEGRSVSEIIRGLLETYLVEKDLGGTIDKIWGDARKKMERKGFSEVDIDSAIRDVRSRK